MKRLIGCVIANVLFYVGDWIGWFEDWRTNSLNETWIYDVAEWFLNQSYWTQVWGGGDSPWSKPLTDEQIDHMMDDPDKEITFDDDD